MKRFLFFFCIFTFSFICKAQDYVVINLKGNCKVQGENLHNRDTLNLLSVIKNDSEDPSNILIRRINSSKAYSFSFMGQVQLKDVLNDPLQFSSSFKEMEIREDVAIAARVSNSTFRDVIYHNRIEFDIAKVLVDRAVSNRYIETEAPYDQHFWGLSITDNQEGSLIRLANYNNSPLFVCAIIVENLNERIIYPMIQESYLIQPLSEVMIQTFVKVVAGDTILLISSRENMNPQVICEIFPIAEGEILKPLELGLNIFPQSS